MSTELAPEIETLATTWHAARRRWGHPMHSLCSYMAMFPPTMPHVFIKWLTEERDIVYDPFAGRGTTVLEARLLKRIGLGADLNPLAVVLSRAKADPPTRAEVDHRLEELESGIQVLPSEGEPEKIRMLFEIETLGQLLWLRTTLDLTDRVDRFLMATLLGILHLNADANGIPRGLTVSMPNTFAMSPGYVKGYIEEEGLEAPAKDVVTALRERLNKLEMPDDTLPRGSVWRQDATLELHGWPDGVGRAKLIFTSPPYLQVIKYGKYNWIRLWLLQHGPKEVDSELFTSSSLDRYIDFMRQTIAALRSRLRSDGFVGLVIGDVRRKDEILNLAEVIAEECLANSDLRLLGIIEDQVPTKHKVSRIWKENRGRATKIDRILLLAGPDAPSPPEPPEISWG